MLEHGKLTAEDALKVLAFRTQALTSENPAWMNGYQAALSMAFAVLANPSDQIAPAWVREYNEALAKQGKE